MLTIPEAIKTLFKTDGVHKNFRVHFPNGEMADITNTNIDIESLRFTESVCSQDVFRFGLTEASVIEFETVGISNMYGMLIECGIEIDTTSLSAAQLTAIQADPGDGTLVLLADSDIGIGYYHVPLGTFRVNSCPRNHGAMTHRKVTAYSLIGGANFYNSPYELAKLSKAVLSAKPQNYTPSIPLLVMAAIGWYAPGFLDSIPKTLVATWSDLVPPPPSPILIMTETWMHGNNSVEARMTYINVDFDTGGYEPDYLYQLDMSGLNTSALDAALDWIKTEVDTLGDDGDSARAYMNERIAIKCYNGMYTKTLPVFYPFCVKGSGLYTSRLQVPYAVTINVDVGGVTDTYTISSTDFYTAKPDLYRFSPTFTDIRGDYAPTSTGGKAIPPLTSYAYTDAYDIRDLANGLFELSGQFGRPSRTGGADIITLDNTSPESIGAGSISDAWWDEYDVSPVGSVFYSYGEGDAAQEVFLAVSDGGSIYNISDNAVLQILTDQATIEAYLNAGLVQELAKVEYTPVEMTMQGWPWIEAGDAVQITAGDGTVVDSFALSIELTGIQDLTARITSPGGQIIEEG